MCIHYQSVIVIAHCNVGGNATCEFGNEIGRGDERIRCCVLEPTRMCDAMDRVMAMAARARTMARSNDGEGEGGSKGERYIIMQSEKEE